ncbi:MAG: hypothetical protein ABI999_13670 [Acidobacteriota bacterium]
MKRVFPRLHFILVLAAAFVVGAGVDAYLRANKGPTCFGCSTYSCVIVELADNPGLLVFWARDGFQHPLF